MSTILISGKKKLDIPIVESVRLVLNEDGTDIDDDDILEHFASKILLLLATAQEWCDGVSDTSKPGPEANTTKPAPEANRSRPVPEARTSKPYSEANTSSPEAASKPGPEDDTSKPDPEDDTSKPDPDANTSKPGPELGKKTAQSR